MDETNYTRQGDKFGAKDINATNAALNKAVRQRNITLPASGWSSQYPFTQTVSVEGLVQEDDLKVIGVLIPDDVPGPGEGDQQSGGVSDVERGFHR